MRFTRTTPCAPAGRTRTVWGSVLIGLAVLSLPAAQAVAKNPKCSISGPGEIIAGEPVTFTADWANFSGSKSPYTVSWTSDPDATLDPPRETGLQSDTADSDVTFATAGQKTVQIFVVDTPMGSTRGKGNPKPKTCAATLTVMVEEGQAGTQPIARGDTYSTPMGKELVVQYSRISGVLYNDFDTDADGNNIGNAGLTAVKVSDPAHGTLSLNSDGSFTYTPDGTQAQNSNDSFEYKAVNGDGNESDVAFVNIHIESDQPDFKIMMNYELGMHCTGFEFSYCCILPPYNSILAQVVKPQAEGYPQSNADFPRLLEGDPTESNLDGLGREIVLRDYAYDEDTGMVTFDKYYLEYFHDAQPRREGNMPGPGWSSNVQTSTLISDVEGNSLLYQNTPFDSACTNPDPNGPEKGSDCLTYDPAFPVGGLVTGTVDGIPNVVVGDGDYTGPADNYANGWLNHFYIYADLEGSNPAK